MGVLFKGRSSNHAEIRIKRKSPSLKLFLLFRGSEQHSFRIHTVSQSGGFWTIIKNVTYMTVTTGTSNFRSNHSQFKIFYFLYMFLLIGCQKLGHPVPELNFVSEENSGNLHPPQMYVPFVFML